MTTSRFTAGASRFAHLAGFSRKAKGAADDDQRDDDNMEDEDEPKGKRSKASDDDDDDAPKGKGSKASDDDDDDDAPKGKRSKASDDDDDDDAPKGKRSKASEDDDDNGDEDDNKEEMNGGSAKASARRREQARIGAILGHAAAANNLPLAVSLAVETRMTRGEAIAVLKGQAGRRHDDDDAPANRHSRSSRADRNVSLGGDAPKPNDKQAISSSWDAAFKRAGVATKPR